MSLYDGMSLVTTYPVEAERMVLWSEAIIQRIPDITGIELRDVFSSIISGEIEFDRYSGVAGIIGCVRDCREKKRLEDFLKNTENEYHPDNFFNNFD